MANNAQFDSADEMIASLAGDESVTAVWQCQQVASKMRGIKAGYTPSTPSWVKALGPISGLGLVLVLIFSWLANKGVNVVQHSFFLKAILALCLTGIIIWVVGFIF